MMKRAIRSVVLAGVIVIISILLSGPQPVQADKSPTIMRIGYIGSIHLRAQAVMDMDNAASAFYYTFFETRGPLRISYDKKSIKISFDNWNILQGTGKSGILRRRPLCKRGIDERNRHRRLCRRAV